MGRTAFDPLTGEVHRGGLVVGIIITIKFIAVLYHGKILSLHSGYLIVVHGITYSSMSMEMHIKPCLPEDLLL